MQPEPANIPKHVSTLQPASDIQASSQHGQHRDDDLQASLQPHSGGPQGESDPPTGGNGRDATRSNPVSDDDDTSEAVGLKGITTAISLPRNKIAEYENALASSPPKPSEGRLFEVTKSNRRPDDKSSPIAKLPNGE